jgi:hypothetical protein
MGSDSTSSDRSWTIAFSASASSTNAVKRICSDAVGVPVVSTGSGVEADKEQAPSARVSRTEETGVSEFLDM